MQGYERLTYARTTASGYWTPHKKDELMQRLAEYEDTGLSPEEIRGLKQAGLGNEKFDQFLNELRKAVQTEVRHGMKSYTSKICFIAEELTKTAGQAEEMCFTAGQIKEALDVAKEIK